MFLGKRMNIGNNQYNLKQHGIYRKYFFNSDYLFFYCSRIHSAINMCNSYNINIDILREESSFAQSHNNQCYSYRFFVLLFYIRNF